MSKHYCCVPGCVESGDSHPVLHVFPNPSKDPDRFNSWVMAIGGDMLGLNNEFIYRCRRVCHRHFEQKHCCRNNRLSQLAIPRKKLSGLLTFPRFTFSEQRTLRPIDNIGQHMPSTSKGKYELFGPEYATEHHFSPQSSAIDNKENGKSKNVNAESNTEFAQSVDTESNFEGQSNVNTESDSEVPDITNTFTWQKSSEVIISDEEDEYLIGTDIDAADLLSSQDNVSTLNDAPAVQGDGAYEAYKCNICSEPIKGFRYRCVQCADYDLCAACEARGAHERHYVLRIPGPRPYTEIQSVLERIRKELMSMNNTVLFEDTHMLDSMKEEVKDELDDPLCEDVTKETYEDERMERMSTTNHSNGDHSGSEQSKDDTDDEEYRPEENENIRVTYTHNVKNARPPNTVPCEPKIKIRNYNSLKRKLSISPTRPTVTNVGNTAQCRETENNDIQGL